MFTIIRQHKIRHARHVQYPVVDRDWGDTVGYFADPDGHIIAIAKKT